MAFKKTNRIIGGWRCVLLAIAMCASGCGGGGDDAGDDPAAPVVVASPPAASASSPVGPTQTEMVVITGADGASVSVPPGAAQSVPVLIQITQSGTGAPALPTTTTTAGTIYEITPHGAAFSVPVEVAIPFDPTRVTADGRPILLKAEPGGAWTAITDVRVDGGLLRASIADFSYFTVANCESYAASTCDTGSNATIQIAAPTVSSAAGSMLLPPPAGASASTVGVLNGFAHLQLAVQFSIAAECMAEYVRDFSVALLIPSSSGSSTSKISIYAAQLYTPENRNFVIHRTRYFHGVLLADATVMFDVSSGDVAALGGQIFNAQVFCTSPSNWNGYQIDASPVRLLSNLPVPAAGTATYQYLLAAKGANPLKIVQAPQDLSVALGQTATFFVTAIDLGSVTYQWERSDDGGLTWLVMAGERGAYYALVNARETDSGAKFRAVVFRAGFLTSGSTAVGGSTVVSDGGTLTVTRADAAATTVPWQATGLIAAGGSASFAIKSDGTLWSWGANNGGVLGRAASAGTPQPVDTLSHVRAVTSGAWYAAAVLDNGDVYAWGWGGNVGTAIGSAASDNPLPMKVPGLSNIRTVSTKYQHTLALDTSGKVFGFGPEASGALGPTIGNDGVRAIDGLANVRQVAAGEVHSLALLADGTVWAWGANSLGQLGVAAETTTRAAPAQVAGLDHVVAIAASSFGSFALRQDGTVFSWGQSFVLGRTGSSFEAIAIPGFSGIKAISAGNYNVFAVDAAGGAFGWGDNTGGRVGVGILATTIATPVGLVAASNLAVGVIGESTLGSLALVAGGEGMGLALGTNGHVYAWGSNASGQLDGAAHADSTTAFDMGLIR